MRFALALVLSVAHLAGPWLCCCGPLAMAAAPRPVPANTPAPEQDSCRHCCPKEHGPPAPVPMPSPKRPTTPDRCPCCGVMVTALPADKPQAPTADALLVIVSSVPSQPFAVASVSAGAVTGLRELPHLTTADRLFAHHVLLC